MTLCDIHLTNFRNHSNTQLTFAAGINALLGDNGQGKTNILEAISYLSLTKSFYAVNDATVLQIGKRCFELEGSIRTGAGLERIIRVGYVQETGQKQFTINGVKPETLSSVIGEFPIVILSPDHFAITYGGPSERRKFLDLFLSQISRSYFEDILEYRRIVRQRNRILAEAKSGRGLPTGLIEPWDISLAEYAARVTHRRQQLVQEFQPYVLRAYKELVRNNETPGLTYRNHSGISETESVEGMSTLLEREIRDRRAEELRKGMTLIGPHRDDLDLRINDMSVARYASQGQHKTFLVALKVAEFFYLSERKNEVPIFLLDDVFGELDDHRSKYLLLLVAGLGQTVITATHEGVFHQGVEWNSHNRKFYIEHGTSRQA